MGDEVVIGSINGAVLGGAVGAGLGALSGIISGSAGAAIMQSANYTGYDVSEAVNMGAVGGSILSGSMGALAGCMSGALISKGFFSVPAASSSGHVIGSVIAGVIGYAVLNAEDYETIMDLEKTAIVFAVGSLATSIPVTLALICIALPIALACLYKNDFNPAETMTNMRNLHPNYGTMTV